MLAELEKLAQRFAEIDELIQDPAVLAQRERYAALLRERGSLVRRVEAYHALMKARRELADAEALAGDKSEPADIREWAAGEQEELARHVAALKDKLLEAMATEDRYSGRNVIVEIRAGTGGEEAALFAADLLRMYRLYAESRGWAFEVMDATPTELGGFREVIVRVKGGDAYSRLRFEGGGHRVQRVPKTESQGRVHTSAATVAIMPEAEEVEIKIDPKDIELSVMRSQGPGGQSVNTTDSAVRLVHKPSGIAVKSQVHKSQLQNREAAYRILMSKLYDREQQKVASERREERFAQTGSGDRSQRIRTYNFPQNRVTDHRLTGDDKNSSLDRVIAGELDSITDKLIDQEKLRLEDEA